MLPNELLTDLKRADVPADHVLDVVTAATARSPWVVLLDRAKTGHPDPYATISSSGDVTCYPTLAEAMEAAGGAVAPDQSGVLCELVPIGEDGSPIEGVPPVSVRGQLADIILFSLPRDVAFSTEQAVGVNRAIKQALANASRMGLIRGSLQVVALPEGCQLFRLQEKK